MEPPSIPGWFSDDQGVQLVGGLGSCLDCAAAGDTDHAKALDRAVGGLGLRLHFPGQHGARSDFSVDGIFARICPHPPVVIVGRRAPGRKCQRCWTYYTDEGDAELCPRCRAVIRA